MIVYNFPKKSPIDLKGTTYPYITVENNANWHQPSGENHEVDVELIDEFPTPRIERTCQKVALKNKMKITLLDHLTKSTYCNSYLGNIRIDSHNGKSAQSETTKPNS